VPKVKPRPRLVQISILLRMMRVGASHRTTMCGNMAVIGMISATSSKIGGTSGTEDQVNDDDL
jgi:hypothetical protein